jgi:hypothetical protein
MGSRASYNRFLQTRNRRRLRSKSRRATKRFRRFRGSSRSRRSRRQLGGGQGGSWTYRIPDEAVVGRTSDEGVQGFKTMEEVRQENEEGIV